MNKTISLLIVAALSTSAFADDGKHEMKHHGGDQMKHADMNIIKTFRIFSVIPTNFSKPKLVSSVRYSCLAKYFIISLFIGSG